jgi:hypothetical protein
LSARRQPNFAAGAFFGLLESKSAPALSIGRICCGKPASTVPENALARLELPRSFKDVARKIEKYIEFRELREIEIF